MSQQLSQELRTLVHHVELNQSGWWIKSVKRLIVAILHENGG